MKRIFLTLLTAMIAVCSVWADGYTNPVWNDDAPDPSVIKAKDGYYYMYATLGRVLRSEDLVNWSWVGWAFNDNDKPSFLEDGAVWAPDINYINGQYVMYYAVSKWNEGNANGIGVATASAPQGPFHVVADPLFTSDQIGVKNSIDPYYFEDTDGKKYLFWGSFNGIYGVELSEDGLSVKSGASTFQIINKTVEAAVMIKRNGYYYFIGSAGTCCDGASSTYHLVVARSQTVNGTYQNKSNQSVKSTVLNRDLSTFFAGNSEVIAPGHCSEIITDDAGKDWIIYHAYMANNIDAGRVVCLSEIKWDSDGWPYVEGGTPKLQNDEAPTVEAYQGWQISTAQDLLDYANTINSLPTSGKIADGYDAVLLNDIDMSGVTFPGIGNDGHENHRFHWTFDGKGHRIKNLVMNGGDCALFPVASDNAVIKNLIIDSSCSFTGGRASAFISASNWPEWGSKKIVFENCGNEATVSGTSANCAAFIGCNYNGGITFELKNCYNTGNVTGNRESGAFTGWFGSSSSTMTNCWNIGEISGVDGNNTLARCTSSGTYVNTYDLSTAANKQAATVLENYDSSWLASGQLAYVMNGTQTEINWYQALGVDTHPMPFKDRGQVYANGQLRCDGTSAGGDLTYMNTSNSVIPPHTPEEGFCSVCGAFLEDFYEPVDGWFEINTAKKLYWYACYINQIDNTAKGKLTADIDYTTYTRGYIGNAENHAYSGEFNGQQHKVTINLERTISQTGLFGYIKGATIRNLVVDGTVTMTNGNCGGGMAGWADGINVENVAVYTTINDNQEGDGTIGGIMAVTRGAACTFKNVAFYGTINAPNRNGNGGMVGWADNDVNTVFENCIVAPANITWAEGATFARKTPTVRNSQAISTFPENSFGNQNNYTPVVVTEAQLTSGEACYLINENIIDNTCWFQTLPGDTRPLPFSNHGTVYANGQMNCDGSAKQGTTLTFANTSAGLERDAHTFNANGICSKCGAGQEPTVVDGFYQIATIGNLKWFADYVNEGRPNVSAQLTADISQGDVVYTPIGNTDHPYLGTFDGKGHSVTLNLLNDGYDYQGIFGAIGDGVYISNLVAKGTIHGKRFVGGIAGGTYYGSSNERYTRIENCGNEATVVATDVNAGGIIGVNNGAKGSASFMIVNCYNIGAISGNESGALSGWSGGGWSYFYNCYNAGKVNNASDADFTRNNGTNIVNCYFVEGSNNATDSRIVAVTEVQMNNGELMALLNGDEGPWRQSVGSDLYPYPFERPYIPGDANSDGKISLADAATIIAVLNGHTPTGYNADAANINKENGVDLMDVKAIIDTLLNK